jgi:Tol biopolymer transport system component
MLRLTGLTLTLVALLAAGMSGGLALGRSEEPFAPWILFVSNRGGDWAYYQMLLDGSRSIKETVLPPVYRDSLLSGKSPDGAWVLYVSRKDNEIYRMRPDESEQENLSQSRGPDSSPEWSPDSKWIVFVSQRDENSEIYRMRPDGSQQQNITQHSASDRDPAWSPDGEWITFRSDRDGNPEIYRMRSDGSEQENLTQHSARDNIPTWSPDGRWILFASDRDSNPEIYRMHADGSQQENLTQNLASDNPFGWITLSSLLFHPLLPLGLAGSLASFGTIFWYFRRYKET